MDGAGKKIQRVCKKCKTRVDAEDYVRSLSPISTESQQDKTLVSLIANTMYIPGSDHFERRRQFGRSVDIDTMKESRGILTKIIADFGEIYIENLTVSEVTQRLLKMNCSGSRKNRYIQILREVFLEAQWFGSRVSPPTFPTFVRNVKKADIFNTDELNRLFLPQNFPDETLFLFFSVVCQRDLGLERFGPCV
jgi:hypothetical protein